MRNVAAIVLLLATAVHESAFAEESGPVSPQEAEFNELTVQHRMLYQQKQCAQAIAVAEQALALAETIFGADGEQAAQVLNDLGRLHQAQGRYAEAEPLFKRSVAIAEQHVAPTDPYLAMVLEQYAACLRSGGDTAEAEAVEERTLAICS